MKKPIFILIFIIFTTANILRAQNISLGLFGGIESRNLSYGSGAYKQLNLGANFGAIVEIGFSEHFSFQSAVEYSAQGSKNGSFVATSGNNNNPDNNLGFAKLNYITVPLLLKYSYSLGQDSHTYIYTCGGPYIGYLLSANEVFLTPNNFLSDKTSVNVRPQLNNTNVGFNGLLGIRYFYNLDSIFLQGGGKYGILKIQKNKINGGNYSGSAALTFGYTFQLRSNIHNNEHVLPKDG